MANVDQELGQAAARSPALERRLRKRRQEARLRMRLAADAALLAQHHASDAPSALPSGYMLVSQAELAALREDIATLRAQVCQLQADRVEPSAVEEPFCEAALSEPVLVAAQESQLPKDVGAEKAEKGEEDEKDERVEALQRKLIDSVTRTADLQGVLEEPFESERGRNAIEKIIGELQASCVMLMVELSKYGVSVDESSFPTLGAEER